MKTPKQMVKLNQWTRKILEALKKKVDDAKGAWLEELPGIMWALIMFPYNTMGETIFSLVYSAKVEILDNIGLW